MMTEEQAHIAYLKDKAQNLGLTFDQYMLFLIFEALDHSPAVNPEPMEPAPWKQMMNQNGSGQQGL
ncbi:MAG: hypothetical protein HUJ55_04920 [Ileibacterium sp.]|nr:hypothetical protein [Ileibacterium sp.]